MTELKNLQAVGMTTMGAALKNTFDLLNINRMQSGIDTFGQGRNPCYLEPSIILCITDGGKLSSSSMVYEEVNFSFFYYDMISTALQCNSVALLCTS